MKTILVAAALLASVSVAHAGKCPSIYSDGYTFNTSGDRWVNDAGVTIKAKGAGYTVNGIYFPADVGAGDYMDLVIGTVEKPVASYEVEIERNTANFVSPELAKLTGGSATFVRKCK